jgi:hypothetical protein
LIAYYLTHWVALHLSAWTDFLGGVHGSTKIFCTPEKGPPPPKKIRSPWAKSENPSMPQCTLLYYFILLSNSRQFYLSRSCEQFSLFSMFIQDLALYLGGLLWYVFSELFLSSSPNKIYADALKKVKLNEEVYVL